MGAWTVESDGHRRSYSAKETAAANDQATVLLPGVYPCAVSVSSGGGTATVKVSLTPDPADAIAVEQVTGEKLLELPHARLIVLAADPDFAAGMAVGWIREGPGDGGGNAV